jgi:predicted transcriptional regulator
MNTQELTQIVTVHQQAIARHDQWQAEHEARMTRIEAILEATAVQQQLNQDAIANLAAQQQLNQDAIANLAAQQQLNQEGIADLRASILDLRNLVADYIQGRSGQ